MSAGAFLCAHTEQKGTTPRSESDVNLDVMRGGAAVAHVGQFACKPKVTSSACRRLMLSDKKSPIRVSDITQAKG